MQVFLVGGAVRDKLLGRPVKDRDWLVVGSTPEAMQAQGYKQVGKDFPVFLHPDSQEEYALARTERKSGRGYSGFICDFSPSISLEQDLIRRDLTINAMAEDATGKLHDPFNGQADIQSKVLRHISPAFAEDPLRVFRVARFAARYAHLGFSVADETLTLMKEIAHSGELEFLTAERVWKETESALLEQSPQVYFSLLQDVGALNYWFAEIAALWGVPQPKEHHPEVDTGVHNMMVVEQAAKLSNRIEVRFAALCHDLGKGLTAKEHWPNHYGHEKEGLKALYSLFKRLPIPKRLQKIAAPVCEFHLLCHRIDELKPTTVVKLLNKLSAFRQPQMLEDFVLACEADAKGRLGKENHDYSQGRKLLAMAKVCEQVDVQEIIAAGFQGKAIAEQLHARRVRALKQWQLGHAH